MADPLLGIIGGMGPEATVVFLRELVAATPAAADQEHIHCLIDMNTRVPDRSAAIREGRLDEVAAILRESAERLQDAGCRYLAMPCNTAHYFLPRFEDCFTVPFIHMIEQVRTAWLHAYPGKRLALLATIGTVTTGVYQQNLVEDLPLMVPDRETAGRVHEVIMLVKAGRTASARDQLADIMDHLMRSGAEGFVLGCTEIPLALPPTELPIVNSITVLAEACVARVRG